MSIVIAMVWRLRSIWCIRLVLFVVQLNRGVAPFAAFATKPKDVRFEFSPQVWLPRIHQFYGGSRVSFLSRFSYADSLFVIFPSMDHPLGISCNLASWQCWLCIIDPYPPSSIRSNVRKNVSMSRIVFDSRGSRSGHWSSKRTYSGFCGKFARRRLIWPQCSGFTAAMKPPSCPNL